MIRVIQDDITQQVADSVVNAANERMLGGGGVDGAIHRAAGPRLLDACRAVPEVRPGVRCPTGEARITPGFGLAARYVIHTVGPVWRGGRHGEAALLAACHRQCLDLAARHGLRSIVFPAISCGAYGYPVQDAAQVAVSTVAAWRAEHDDALAVTFCCFGADTFRAFRSALASHPPT